MRNPSYIVSLSEQAFFAIVTSALEAYSVEHVIGSTEPLETYGNLWGHEGKSKRGEKVLHIALADVDTSADRQCGSVAPKQESFDLKADFIDHFRPELEYLGDFHSHPYDNANDKVKTAAVVERQKLYEFSKEDFDCAKLHRETRQYRVGMVATIFQSEKPVVRESKYVGPDDASCIRFSYNDMTIWLKCYVFGDKKRVTDSLVALVCPALGLTV